MIFLEIQPFRIAVIGAHPAGATRRFGPMHLRQKRQTTGARHGVVPYERVVVKEPSESRRAHPSHLVRRHSEPDTTGFHADLAKISSRDTLLPFIRAEARQFR